MDRPSAEADGRPLRIVYLTLEATRRGQAAHTHVHEIVAGLGRLGAEVELIEPGHSVRPSPAHPLARLAAYGPLQARAARRLAGADLLYLRAHPFALPIAEIARRRAVPVVHEINGRPADLSVTYPWARPLARALAASQRRQYRAAAGLVAVTPGLADWARAESGGRVAVALVPNGASTSVFRPDASGGPRVPGPYVAFFGGLVRWHGVATLIAAVEHPDWPADLRLAVAGHGPESRVVAEAAARQPRLLSLGYLPQDEVAGLAARALASVVPIENLGERASGGVAPLKLFESLAAGAPVIATDLPFQADLVRKGRAGLVVPPGDPGALARAARMLLVEPERARAMGARGRALVVREHSWDRRAADTLRFLREVISSAEGRGRG